MGFVLALTSCGSGSSSDDSSSAAYEMSSDDSSSAAYEMSSDKYSAVENEDGIYFEFELPSEKIARCDVSIEGIGQIAEFGFAEDAQTGSFFYPFVDAGKEYKIHFSFMKPEIKTEGFVLPQDDYLAYFDVKATAGAKSKGEIKLSSKGKVAVTESGTEFRFVERPEFTGAGKSAFESGEWCEEIGLVEGISWDHEDRMTNWMNQIQIAQKDLETPLNLYEEGRIDPKEHTIDFLCIRPKMQYKYKDETFTYQWDGFTFDINYPSKALARSWDTLGPSNADRLHGTWICEHEDMEDEESFITKEKYRWTMTFAKSSLTEIIRREITKFDGTEFTKEERRKIRSELADKDEYVEPTEVDGLSRTNEYKIGNGGKTITVKETFQEDGDWTADAFEDEDDIIKISKDEKAFMLISYDDKYPVTNTFYFKKQ